MKKTFSVIVPHYNCSQLLQKCLSSIPDREDIQVIVADDESDSSEIEKIKSFLKQSNRRNVEFFELKKGGAGSARNFGISKAIGEWILFCDSDDFFSENSFDTFSSFVFSEYDIVFFKHRSVFSNSEEKCVRFPSRNQNIERYLNKSTKKNENDVRFKDVVPWAKLIRSSLIKDNNIIYEQIPANEDVMFVLKCNTMAKKVFISNMIPYVCTARMGSLTMSKNKEKSFVGFKVAIEYNKYVETVGHPEYGYRLLSYVINARRKYGKNEALRYMKEARRQNVSIYKNAIPSIKEIVEKIKDMCHPNYYRD